MTRDLLLIDIATRTAAWGAAPFDAEAVARRATGMAWRNAGNTNRESEVSIVLGDDSFVRELNSTYRGQDKATNVLSFPADGENGPDDAACLLGDIVLAYETMAREAAEQNKSLADHLSHLCVHGLLHLLGHDHQTPSDARKMEALEISILAELGISDPFTIPAQET
ncbi:MAG: rRNA maturation RNase YbeY [Alphaproteobacteria bacterium]